MLGQLILETGETFDGVLMGDRPRTAVAEVVFTTAMSGYQETFTDPSYCEQIVVVTVAHLGNVGVNPWDVESRRVQVAGVIASSVCTHPSSWRSHGSLSQWLDDAGVPFLANVETRFLTQRLREKGVVKGWMGPKATDVDRIRRTLREAPSMSGRDLVTIVTTPRAYPWTDGTVGLAGEERPAPKPRFRVAVMDFGVKHSILRQLVDAGYKVMVFPSHAKPDEILAFEPHGVFLSNGPGDPGACEQAIATVRALLGKKPIFGICMGHQILGHALGGTTFKLPFGHRSINHPVKNMVRDEVEITSHNHGFSVDAKSLPSHVEVTHLSLNDQTVEGLRVPKLRAFSVQYHPEACPGPHDSHYLFSQFTEMMERNE